jgi:hypothetical protein
VIRANNRRVRELALRVLDDTGAETLRRYLAQIQYTAFWCIRMLRDAEGIEAVIPEGGEDVVIVRNGCDELRQVKTRAESQGAWTLAEVLPILCQQYHRRSEFSTDCTFHFVSDQGADVKTASRWGCGTLFRLKEVLELRRTNALLPKEITELAAFEAALIPKVKGSLLADYGETIDEAVARDLLYRTAVETRDTRLQEYDWPSEFQAALRAVLPGQTPTLLDLEAAHAQLLVLVLERIANTTTRAERQISRDDVLGCWLGRYATQGVALNLAGIPGETALEKKCVLGGFDPVAIANIARLRVQGDADVRELETLGHRDTVDRLAAALADVQADCLDEEAGGAGAGPLGPRALRRVRPHLPAVVARYFPQAPYGDPEQFGVRLLWRETGRCYVRWDRPSSTP